MASSSATCSVPGDNGDKCIDLAEGNNPKISETREEDLWKDVAIQINPSQEAINLTR